MARGVVIQRDDVWVEMGVDSGLPLSVLLPGRHDVMTREQLVRCEAIAMADARRMAAALATQAHDEAHVHVSTTMRERSRAQEEATCGPTAMLGKAVPRQTVTRRDASRSRRTAHRPDRDHVRLAKMAVP